MTKSVVSEQEYIKKNISGKPRTYSGFFPFYIFERKLIKSHYWLYVLDYLLWHILL